MRLLHLGTGKHEPKQEKPLIKTMGKKRENICELRIYRGPDSAKLAPASFEAESGWCCHAAWPSVIKLQA
jgi:hypothetical protein